MHARVESRSWWRRNLVWVILGAVLLCVLLFAGFLFAIIKFATGMIRSAEPYRVPLARALAHPEVTAALGQPIEEGWLPKGNISMDGRSGNADLGIPISGPRGEATISVLATRRAGVWHYELMQVERGGAAPIDLRESGDTPTAGE